MSVRRPATSVPPAGPRPGRAIAIGLALAGALAGLASVPAAAQDIRAAVSPDTVTVGDVARAAIRIDLPAGYRAVLPDSLVLDGDLEAAGPRSVWREPREDGGERVTVAYAVSAWRPGTADLPAVAVRISGPDGDRTVQVPLPSLEVRSVLPGDAAQLDPRPLKDVLGANRALWPFLFLAGILLVLAAMWIWRRRRRTALPAPVPAEPDLPPREAALEILDRAMAARLVETGRMKAFYSEVGAAVRLYLDALDPRWGADLTTSELANRLAQDVAPPHRHRALRVLAAADMVKFARRHPTVEQARADWELAREWVQTFERPVVEEPAAAMGAAGDGTAGPAARDGRPAPDAGPGMDSPPYRPEAPARRSGETRLAAAGSGASPGPGAAGGPRTPSDAGSATAHDVGRAARSGATSGTELSDGSEEEDIANR